jgi:hypothetical protein
MMRLLAGLDWRRLADSADAVDVLIAWERCARWVTAQQMRAVVTVAGPQPTDGNDFGREEVRVALADVGGSTKSDVDLARDLLARLPNVLAALEAGTVSYACARVLVRETDCLDRTTAVEVAGRMLAKARVWSPSRLRDQTRREVIKADPVAAELRAQRESNNRQVAKRAEPDGQASMWLNGPAPVIEDDLDRAGRARRQDLDAGRADPGPAPVRHPRPTRRRRAGRARGPPAGATGCAGVCVCLRRRRDLGRARRRAGRTRRLRPDPRRHGPGLLPGRHLAGRGHRHHHRHGHRRLRPQLHPLGPHAAAPARPRPDLRVPRLHRRRVVLRRRPQHPHASGGTTDLENCGLFCRRHHRLKTFTNWTWRRLPDGTLEWTDPHGRTWHRDPIRYAMPERAPSRRPDKPPAKVILLRRATPEETPAPF